MESPDIPYFCLPEYPSQRLFSCDQYRGCAISAGSCAKRWRKAQIAEGEPAERISKCRGCELGALHADEDYVFRNVFFGSDRCARCLVGGVRIIGNRICVSCYNREREFKAGANARGNPVTFSLVRRVVGVVVDFDKPNLRYFEVAEEYTKDAGELILQIGRVTPGRIAFTKPLGRPAINTLQLARVFRKKPDRRTFGGAARS